MTMGRIIKTIEIEGRPATALFDTGANYTYVRSSLVRKAPKSRVKSPVRVTLGGMEIEVKRCCFIQGKIEGLDFFTDAGAVPGCDRPSLLRRLSTRCPGRGDGINSQEGQPYAFHAQVQRLIGLV